MKRGFALALLTLATSLVVSAQVHGGRSSGTSMGSGRGATPGFRSSASSLAPRSFAGGVSARRVGSGIAFGHHPGFVTGSRNRGIHRRYYPGIVGPYYWPYYGSYYPYDAYDSNAYQQNQPVVNSAPDDDRYGDHSFAESRSSARQALAPPAPAPEQDPTVLVFRDGHKQEVRNYAIVGQMLWDFSAKGTHKIPLADLDLDTTRKLNDERGVDFVLPKT
jgi:hypothetical protein